MPSLSKAVGLSTETRGCQDLHYHIFSSISDTASPCTLADQYHKYGSGLAGTPAGLVSIVYLSKPAERLRSLEPIPGQPWPIYDTNLLACTDWPCRLYSRIYGTLPLIV